MIRRTAALVVAALALAGCGGSGESAAEGTTTSAEGGVRELANILDLRSDFETDAGKTRVILLFSPT